VKVRLKWNDSEQLWNIVRCSTGEVLVRLPGRRSALKLIAAADGRGGRQRWILAFVNGEPCF